MDEKETERAQLCCRNEEIRNQRQALTREELANNRRISELDGQAIAEACYVHPGPFAARYPELAEDLRRGA